MGGVTKLRLSAKLLCAVASAALLPAAPAAAQTVTRIVAFGDSYADEGNFFQLTGISTPVYPTGRFSGPAVKPLPVLR